MRDRWDTGRTEAFSDGVFAIAITLLILDIQIPAGELQHLGHALLEAWPSYLAYVTSFLTIGAVWLVHHGLFSRLRYVDARLIRLNLVLLMVVSFLPFPTRLMAEAIKYPHSERAAVLLYGADFLAIALLLAAMYRVAAHRTELLVKGVSVDQVRALSRRVMPSETAIVVAVLLAIFEPRLAAFMYLCIAVLLVLSAHGARVPEAEEESAAAT